LKLAISHKGHCPSADRKHTACKDGPIGDAAVSRRKPNPDRDKAEGNECRAGKPYADMSNVHARNQTKP